MPIPPCVSCPWKKSTKTSDIPGGGMEHRSMEGLDRNMLAMGCHMDPVNVGKPCSGFMTQEGFNSVGVRIAAMFRRFHPDEYDNGGHRLYDSFQEMLDAHHEGVE